MAQVPKKIIIENSDYFDINQIEAPDATLLTGNVRVNHDGVIMTCNKAYYFQKENYIARYTGTCWTLAGNVNIYYDDDFDYIDDTNCFMLLRNSSSVYEFF